VRIFRARGGTTLARFGFTVHNFVSARGVANRRASLPCAVFTLLRGSFSLADKTDKEREAATPAVKRVPQRPADPQMGVALRSVYQRTVEEAVPDDLLDLLSKLD
jgi:hypothetical protein